MNEKESSYNCGKWKAEGLKLKADCIMLNTVLLSGKYLIIHQIIKA
jgi:hypothetical protein